MLVTLTIAGSDSLGGAGIEADIKAMASLGAHPAVSITAVTSQNSQKVSGIFPIPASVVISQLDAILEDSHISGAKIGMLYSAEVAEQVAKRLKTENFPIVVDPVFIAGVGDSLKTDELIEAIRKFIIPIATLITPNIPEAEDLTGIKIKDQEDIADACRRLHSMGADAVLIKGGHLDGPCIDTLFSKNRFLKVKVPRVQIRGHGGGCILSSLITVHMARGINVWESYLRSKIILDESIKSNYAVGHGVPAMSPIVQTYLNAEKMHRMPKL